MKLFPILATLGFCVTAPAAWAQVRAIDPLSIPSGARARIIGPASAKDYIKLTVIGVTPDTLRYRLNGEADSKALSWQNISRMDVIRGKHTNFSRGLGIGLLVGVVGGAALGGATGPGGSGDYCNKGCAAVFTGLFFGAVGGIAGGVIGLVARSENWIPVSLPHAAQKNPEQSLKDFSTQLLFEESEL